MTAIKATVTGTQIAVQVNGPLTSGMVGLPIEFTFDETWEGLNKTAVFRASGLTKDRLNIEKNTTVPWEVMEKTGCCLFIGVYGTNEDGSLAIPTVWGMTDPIAPGADPSGDKSADPSLPVWAQLQKEMGNIDKRTVKTVNGTAPDKNGDVPLPVFDLRPYFPSLKEGYSEDAPISLEASEQFHSCVKNGTFIGIFDLAGDIVRALFVGGSADEWEYNATTVWNGRLCVEVTCNDDEILSVSVYKYARDDRTVKSVNGTAPDESGNVNVERDSYMVKAFRTLPEETEEWVYTTEGFSWEELQTAVEEDKAVFCRVWNTDALVRDDFTMIDDYTMSYFSEEENLVMFTRSEDTVTETAIIFADGTVKHARNDHKPTGITKTLIWQNASPTSGFGSQTIPRDLTPYSEIEVEFICSPFALETYGDIRVSAKVTTKLDTLDNNYYPTGFASNYMLSSTGFHYVRNFRRSVDGDGVFFSASYPSNNKNATTGAWIVPYKIYGIKGVAE